MILWRSVFGSFTDAPGGLLEVYKGIVSAVEKANPLTRVCLGSGYPLKVVAPQGDFTDIYAI